MLRITVTDDADQTLLNYSTDPNENALAPGADEKADVIEALEDALAFLRNSNGEEEEPAEGSGAA